jgi:sigma-B regulation protein RsbU (phosphoserine phosphatase)
MYQDNILNQSSILVVDDNVKNLQILGGILQNEGFQVEFALDGISALNWLENQEFDLVLLDIMMHGMDGFEVCSQIKKNRNCCETPIIFITAQTDSDSIVKGFETGAVDYITKPFIKNELLARVTTQLNVKRTKDQLKYYLKDIEEKNKNIGDSIEYASYIQNAVISTSENNLKVLPEHFIIYLPKDILSGDFYWISQTEGKVIVAVMDCTGHGVPGAIMSILGNTLLNEIILRDHILQPDQILNCLRSRIINALGQTKKGYQIKDGIDGSVICIDPGSDKIQYSGAFNPLILIHENQVIEIKADRIPIGYFEIIRDFTLNEIKINKNDMIYMFSDGIIDQFGGPYNKRFMLKKLKEILLRVHKRALSEQKEIIFSELNLWQNDFVQTDDILLLGIRI